MKRVRNRLESIAAALAIALAAVSAAHAQSAPAQFPSAPTAPTPAIAANPSVLQAEVIGLRNAHGDVVCSLFNDPTAFPRDDSKVLRTVKAPIDRTHALCKFTGIPPGEYAMVVFHDENGDGEFNQNAFGMPEEGYGFSRDAAALFSAPSFESARFHYDGTRLYMIINIRY
jgi:uncharacterized protein (DUF2141 family)